MKCIVFSHNWAFHPIFRFSFWLTKLPKTKIGWVIFWKVGLLSGAVTIVSVISGPSIFCSVLWNFQAVSWEQGANRSIKVTTLSKQICIKNKINLSSVNWKFKRRSGTSFNLSQWIKFKICPLQLKSLFKQIKTVQKLFHILP